MELGNVVDAYVFFKKSLLIKRNTYQLPNLSIAKSLNNIGRTYGSIISNHDMDKALTCFFDALKIQRDLLPENSEEVAQTYYNISKIYSINEYYNDALKYMKKSLTIYKNTINENSYKLLDVYFGMGEILFNLHRIEEALFYLNNSLKIGKRNLPNNHLKLAYVYLEMGKCYLNLQENTNALTFLLQSLNILRQKYSPAHSTIAASYQLISIAYKRLGNTKLAKEYEEKMNRIFNFALNKKY